MQEVTMEEAERMAENIYHVALEDRERAYSEFVQEHCEIWTPKSIFDDCCGKWLLDGNGYPDPFGERERFRIGCNGGCNRDHPVITLDFVGSAGDSTSGKTTASISHLLDPFLGYFERRVQEGTAALLTATSFKDKNPSGTRSYLLDGFLRENRSALGGSARDLGSHGEPAFKAHLIVVKPGALDRSDEVQKKLMEMEDVEERAAKRRGMNSCSPDPDLLFDVMQICYENSLCDHLDFVDLAHLRLTCKAMGSVAARMAANRMSSIRLSCLVMVDGNWKVFGTRSFPRPVDDNLIEDFDASDERNLGSDVYVFKAAGDKLAIVPLLETACSSPSRTEYVHDGDARKAAKTVTVKYGVFIPSETQSELTYNWDSGPLLDGDYPGKAGDPDDLSNYAGHRIRLQWGALEGADTTSADSAFMQGEEVVGDFYFRDPSKLEAMQRLKSSEAWGGKIELQILGTEVIKTTRLVDESETGEVREQLVARSFVQYRGSFRIQRVSIEFAALLKCVATKKQALLNDKLDQILDFRPLTSQEEAQQRALKRVLETEEGK
ncbi:expressed unknown protein [Seminavis robusta]|uniref:Uncharacterized protein n=1 Tax=Seminavis robusta TaxID=568900 RepID=A0A9N8EUM4_9STRA|nr:expressed unknown protein [Seminavis robusta]|eukprot:Sro1670_g289990.1 n/a (550) ;mRNA; f:16920-18569